MSDIKHQQVDVSQLRIGMFVAELDIPWLESPFMMQGFVIEKDEEIATLKKCCQHVFIDRTKSVGMEFQATAKQNVNIKRDGVTVVVRHDAAFTAPEKNKSNTTTAKKDKPAVTSFFDVLKNIKKTNTDDSFIFNMEYVRETPTQQNSNRALNSPPLQNTSQNKSENVASEGFFSGLFRRKAPAEKLSTQVDGTTHETDVAPDTERTYIYTQPMVEEEIVKIYPVFEKSNVAMREMFESIADAQHLDLTAVSEVLDSMVESISRAPDALMWLSKLKNKDSLAYNQALHVSINMMAFSNFLAFPKKQIKDMGMAGLLQDIGKTKIPDEILYKNGKLTAEEYALAKTHVDEALNILEETADISTTVILLVSQHHERIDGSGYPYQMSGNKINIYAQIAGLVDTYCALTSHRSYAKALYNQEALDKIQQLGGKQFSQQLIDQLVQFLGIYPVSSLVELNTGEVAVVIQQNQVRRLQPRIMVLLDANKTKHEYPPTLDLINNPLTPNGEPYKIKHGVSPEAYDLNPEDFYLA